METWDYKQKMFMSFLIISTVGILFYILLPRFPFRDLQAWVPFFVSEENEVFEYLPSIVRRPSPDTRRVWVKSNQGRMVFIELKREEWSWRIIKNSDREKLRTIKSDSAQEALALLLF